MKKLTLDQKIINQKARLAKLEEEKKNSGIVKSKNLFSEQLDFKIGDYVVCIDNNGVLNQLSKEPVYKIVGSYSTVVDITNDKNQVEQYYKNRFRLATVKEIEEYQKKQNNKTNCPFKIGDYVTCLNNTYTLQISGFILDKNRFLAKDILGITNEFFIKTFRLAINDEIYKYLINEATKDGFVIGAKVRNPKYSRNPVIIKKFRLITKDNYKLSSISIEDYYIKTKSSFLAACFNDGGESPLNEYKLVEQKCPVVNQIEKKTLLEKINNCKASIGQANKMLEEIIKEYEQLVKQINYLEKE